MPSQPQRATPDAGLDSTAQQAAPLDASEAPQRFVIVQRVNTNGIPRPRISAVSNAILMELLLSGEYTERQLCERCGLNERTVRDYVRELHKRRAVYIVDWIESTQGRAPTPVWRMGYRQFDAPKPRPLTSAQRAARYRNRKQTEQARRSPRPW